MKPRNLNLMAAGKVHAGSLLAGITLLTLCLTATAQVGLKTYTGTFDDGATYLIEVPRDWNKALIIFSNGYTFPGFPNPPADNDNLLTRLYLLSHGYALAGSAYATEGWAVEDGMRDQILVLDKFKSLIGQPKRTIAWGGSMGGEITAGLLQNHPERFSGGVSVCGVVSGTVGLWNEWLDSAFAFNVLLASSSLQIVNITDPWGNLDKAEQVLFDAQATPQGQARIALAAALIDSSGWIDPFSPEPDPTDYANREANQFNSLSGGFFLFFPGRAELEARSGGNPSWNTRVDYHKQLQRSINYAEVQALYQQADLNLDADLDVLNRSSRVAADPAALNYATQNISFNGELKVPFLTMHTTGDDLVNVQVEQAYRAVVQEKHNAAFLRQTFVHRAGHCNFTSAESIAAIETLIHRLDTGKWQGVDPDTLNAAAGALPPVYNALGIGAPVMDPAFVDYTPAKFLRRFDAP
jgi:pimeloyl-ACP methyl ester carboxylesterase